MLLLKMPFLLYYIYSLDFKGDHELVYYSLNRGQMLPLI